MGGITSKFIDELVSPHTPKTKRIPFDPRSPSDDISRTPITRLNTSDSGIDTTPTDEKVKVIDPRSPNEEVSRTPIIIEKKEWSRRRPFSLKQNNTDSFLCSVNDENKDEDMQDPRSPTTKVPRTPLEDKVLDLEFREPQDDQKKKEDTNENTNTPIETQESNDTQEDNNLVKKLFTSDGPVDKIRRPLGLVVQNTNLAKTPRDLLQAKHCKNVEEEYNKNIHSLIPDNDHTVQSNTEFVENI